MTNMLISDGDDTDFTLPKAGTPGRVLFRYDEDDEGAFYEVYDSDDDTDVYWAYEGIGLDYVISEYISFPFQADRWYVIEGLTVNYSKDYEGEVDEEWTYEKVRPATKEEIENESLV